MKPDEKKSYVVAVSGGVDSTVLVTWLMSSPVFKTARLEVAHFNHGWSDDAAGYEAAARVQAERYDLPFHTERKAVPKSEAAARTARYTFLRRIMRETQADAMITAHHGDDLIETVILNVQRGTGRRGLSPFGSQSDILRPLLHMTKADILKYAHQHKLAWVEDPSNADTRYRRNEVRHVMLPRLRKHNPRFDSELAATVTEAAVLNDRIDSSLKPFAKRELLLSELRQQLPDVLQEILMTAIQKAQPGAELNRRTIEQLAVDIKTGRTMHPRSLTKQLSVSVAHDTVTIVFSP